LLAQPLRDFVASAEAQNKRRLPLATQWGYKIANRLVFAVFLSASFSLVKLIGTILQRKQQKA
jgi:hypothetical protein